MSGVQSVFSFLLEMPSLLSQCGNAFPPVLYVYLLAAFGVIIAIRVLELLP